MCGRYEQFHHKMSGTAAEEDLRTSQQHVVFNSVQIRILLGFSLRFQNFTPNDNGRVRTQYICKTTRINSMALLVAV